MRTCTKLCKLCGNNSSFSFTFTASSTTSLVVVLLVESGLVVAVSAVVSFGWSVVTVCFCISFDGIVVGILVDTKKNGSSFIFVSQTHLHTPHTDNKIKKEEERL